MTPLDMYNGLSQVYCIKPNGRIHWYTKGIQRIKNKHHRQILNHHHLGTSWFPIRLVCENNNA